MSLRRIGCSFPNVPASEPSLTGTHPSFQSLLSVSHIYPTPIWSGHCKISYAAKAAHKLHVNKLLLAIAG